jgi:V/A-type H+-transporting ATPase subunit E
MSLETVTEDVKEEARADAEEIRAEGEQRAEEIREGAESDAEEIVSEREEEVERQIAQERDRTLSSANLEAKQKRLEARRDVLQDVREEASEEIATIDGDTRADLTETLLEDAAAEFGAGSEVSVYGRADDEELLAEIIDAGEYENYEFAGEFDCLGGVVTESETSRVRVNNTFDSVFDDVWEANLKEVSDRLFENGDSGAEAEAEAGDGNGSGSGSAEGEGT